MTRLPLQADGMVFIHVCNGRAIVSRFVESDQESLTIQAAMNWQELEQTAVSELLHQGESLDISDQYECSESLIHKAEFDPLTIAVRMELLIRQIEDLPKALGGVHEGMIDLTAIELLEEALVPILDQARTLQARLQP